MSSFPLALARDRVTWVEAVRVAAQRQWCMERKQRNHKLEAHRGAKWKATVTDFKIRKHPAGFYGSHLNTAQRAHKIWWVLSITLDEEKKRETTAKCSYNFSRTEETVRGKGQNNAGRFLQADLLSAKKLTCFINAFPGIYFQYCFIPPSKCIRHQHVMQTSNNFNNVSNSSLVESYIMENDEN